MKLKPLTFLFLTAALSSAAAAQATGKLDRAMVRSTVDSACALLQADYVFPETAARMAKLLRKNLKSGAYDRLDGPEALAVRVTEDMRSVSRDLHLALMFAPQRIAVMRRDSVQGERQPEVIRACQRNNFGFHKVERLPGNVGYLDLRGFCNPQVPGAGTAAVAAMNLLAHTQAVIFDMRRNGGGYPEMIQLLSTYLFEGEAHLNDLYNRPTNSTQQYWVLPWVPGPRLSKVPVYVLTSNYTFSGAEEFTNNLRELKRATVVGEPTGGGAHPVDFKVINDLFALKVSIGRAINPVSGKNWEGTGVQPHVKVPADSALDVAYLMALDTLQKAAADPAERQELAGILAVKRAEERSLKATPAMLERYPGKYGIRTISAEAGQLFFQREGGQKLRLIPVSEKDFVIDQVGGTVTFTTGAGGGIDGFDLIRSAGDTVRCPIQ